MSILDEPGEVSPTCILPLAPALLVVVPVRAVFFSFPSRFGLSRCGKPQLGAEGREGELEGNRRRGQRLRGRGAARPSLFLCFPG